jgi:TPR repeat protein
MLPKILIALASLFWLGTAVAGFEEGVKAYQAKDYATAMAEARKAVEANDPRGALMLGLLYDSGLGVERNATEAYSWFEKAAKGRVKGAFSKLAWAHLRGDGTFKDMNRALTYSRLSASFDDPEGMFVLYLTLTATSLGFLDEKGRPDEAKYKALAARPISERKVDTEARDALYRSAQKGYPLAIVSLATTLGGTLGENNRKKMLTLSEQVPAHRVPALRNYEKVARDMESLGTSYATPQLFADAQTAQMTTAMVKACGLNPTDTQKAESAPGIVSTAISTPLADAVYLPSEVAGYERAYLVSGTWEEEWTYKACGNTVSFIVKFKADGLGGARNESLLSGKDIPGAR